MKKSEEAWKEYQDFKNKVTGGKMWRVTIEVRLSKERYRKLRRLYRIAKH